MRFKIFFLTSALIVFFPLSALSQLSDLKTAEDIISAYKRGQRDFSNWNLRDVDLSEALSGANLKGALEGANLRGKLERRKGRQPWKAQT